MSRRGPPRRPAASLQAGPLGLRRAQSSRRRRGDESDPPSEWNHFVTEQPADIRDADTDWNRPCPHCGAKVQSVARACWQCGAQINDPNSEHLDYKAPAVDADE